MSRWRGRPAELRGGVGGHSICDLEELSNCEDPHEWGRDFVIPEASLLRKGWNVVVISLITYTSTIFPFRLCFMEFKVPEPIPASVEFEVLETAVDVLFFCDLVLNFLFSYQDAHGREIFSLPSIARKYIRGHFTINLIGCIPPGAIGWILELSSQEATGTKAVQLVRLQKVTRFAQFLRLVRIFRAFPYLAQSLMFKRIRSLRGTRIVNFIVVLLWVVHLVACGWYLVASLHDDHQETWIGRRVVDTKGTTLYEASPEEQWLHAMYFVLAVFTTVGFGDIAAVTSAEVAYALLTMMIGIVINSIIVGKMVTAVTRVDQQDIERSKQKDLIEGFAEHAQLGPARSEELFASLDTSRAVHRGFDRDQVRTLLNSSHLPRLVMGQLPRDVFGGRLLQNRIIRDLHCRLEMPARLPLLITVAVHQRYVYPKEVVYYCYDHPESLFLVLEGTFANVAKPDCAGGLSELPPSVERLFRISEQYGTAATGKHPALYPYQLFSFGSYFGEAELLLEGCPRRSCTRCESDSGGVLLALHKDDLASIVREFPRFASAWRDAALRREAYRRVLLSGLTQGRTFRQMAACTLQRYVRHRMASRPAEPSHRRRNWSVMGSWATLGRGNDRCMTRSPRNLESQPATQADLNKLRYSIGELHCMLQQMHHGFHAAANGQGDDPGRAASPADSVRTPPVEQKPAARKQRLATLVAESVEGRHALAPFRAELPGSTCDGRPASLH